MKKRKAETLIEIVVAGAVFLVMMGGICDFIAGQTLLVARAEERLKVKYYAQKWVNSGDTTITEADGGEVKFSYEDDMLTVTKGQVSVNFPLK